MSTLKEIRGQTIRSLSSDPSPVTTGDMWYNSTSQTLKGRQGVGAWTSGGALGTGRHLMGFGGTQTAGIIASGITPPGATKTTNAQGWDGTSWSTKPSVATARTTLAGSGTSAAGLVAGGNSGSVTNATEEFTQTVTLKTITDS